jgi:hypothetical protein
MKPEARDPRFPSLQTPPTLPLQHGYCPHCDPLPVVKVPEKLAGCLFIAEAKRKRESAHQPFG